MELNQVIKNKRLERKMTRKYLADLIGTSEQYLYQIESGKRNVSKNIQPKLIQALGIKIIYK